MKDKLIVYISSRNNYEMLVGEVLKNNNFKDIRLINIDDNSSDQQKKIGRDICRERNITFIENNGRGLFCAARTAIEYVSQEHPECKFVYWTSHDCFPITENMFLRLEEVIESGQLDSFGCVGFNTIWKKFMMDISEFESQNLEGRYCGALGRACLTPVPGAGWYRPSDFDMTWDKWGKSVAVESVVDMNFMINVRLFIDNVDVDTSYHHFCWGDDLCLQFLKSGIYNIALASFYVYHDQDIKKAYGIPVNSYRAAKRGDMYHFCEPDSHFDVWHKKWGFQREWQKNPGHIENSVKEKYNKTLIGDFMNHDYSKGPLKCFPISI